MRRKKPQSQRENTATLKSSSQVEHRNWLWVTGKEFYFDQDGRERQDWLPTADFTPRSWWTCDKKTRAGDTVLIYRKSPIKDVAFLAVATSDAHETTVSPMKNDATAWICDSEILEHFDHPLLLSELRTDPALSDWAALKINLVGRSHSIPGPIWDHLLQRLRIGRAPLANELAIHARQLRLEREIETALIDDLSVFNAHGYRLTFKERQVRLASGGIADFVCWDARLKTHVVVELKRGRVDFKALGQVLAYREDLGDIFSPADSPPAHGLLVGEAIDSKVKNAVRATARLHFIALGDLGIAVG